MIRCRVSGQTVSGRFFGLGATALMLALTATVILAGAPARASEQSLLGIKIYSTAKTVLQKFGNPTRVEPGAPTSAPLAAGAVNAGFPGMGGGGIGPLPQMQMGGPPMGGQAYGAPMGMGAPGGDGERGDMPGEFGPPGFAGGGMPPGLMGRRFGGGPPPGMMPGVPNGQPGIAGQTGTETFQNQEVTYIYDKPNGLTYAFLLSPSGRVIQITVAGYKDASRTSRGIALGSSYSQVLAKYGFPEQQQVEGDTVFLSYAQRAHVAFQLMRNKVVSIMVAYVQ